VRRPVRIRLAVVVGAVTLLLASDALASDPRLWIASGSLGGTYRSVYAQKLEVGLYGYLVLHRSTSGSGENLDLLATGKADIAFAQADVYAERLARDADQYDPLMVIGRLADECVYIAYRKGGAVSSLEQLAAPVNGKPAKVAVGAEKGGMNGTWQYLETLDPRLADAKVEFTGDTLALNQLAVGAFDAVGWVTDPTNFEHKMLRALLDNDALELMNLEDKKLVEPLPSGTQVYSSQKVKLTNQWRGPEATTICTSAMVFMRKDANPKLISKISDVISLDLKKIVPQNKKP
jgi:TRAP-type uncharacterized transport system substrate-binding protein